MLRFRPITDAKAAAGYYGKSDGGYYLDSAELRREVGGKAASALSATTDPEHLKRLLSGLDPRTGKQLTAKLVDNRIAGWDVTASVPKGVTIAIQAGDKRVQEALWEAARETMADLEAVVTTRVRKGGKEEDRVTRNMMWFAFEHPETRPAKEDGMPDPDRHIHFVIPNVTYDPAEQEWKAIKFRPIMELRKYFDRSFDLRLSSKLTDLGYEIGTKYVCGERGKRFYSWDIKGFPQSVTQKFSRRSAEVEKLAENLGIENPLAKDKLGATSRLHKLKDMTYDDYRKYWSSRITSQEGGQIADTIKAALLGTNLKPANTADKGIAYAISQLFERQSVVNWTDLAITAMERCMGGAKPEQFEPEARKQGVLFKDGQVTTQEVLEEERRVIAFARDGRGTCRPIRVSAGAPDKQSPPPAQKSQQFEGARRALPASIASDIAILSPEQQAICRHVWDSPDRVILIRGGAGTGKTHTMKTAIAGIDRHVVVLAPSADASRTVLRKDGFTEADTVSSFLSNDKAQEKARSGLIWVDEAGLLPIADTARLMEIAGQLNARIVLQGDPKQHKSVSRHGNLFHVLQEFAGLPVAELKDIRRQSGRYKEAVAAIDQRKFDKAYGILDELGVIRKVGDNTHLVDEYMAGLASRKEMLVIAPTHAEGDEITAEIRQRLKENGAIGQDERVFDTLTPTGWTEAERFDPSRYIGDEVIQFVRNSGAYRAGDRVEAMDFISTETPSKHFAVYTKSQTSVAVGDTIRITANGKSKEGHRLNNGSLYTVKGFNKKGGIVLNNGWALKKDFAHFRHGYVSTSVGGQGKTVDRVLIAMGSESLPAINAEQFYVSVSRGREKALVFTDLSSKSFREAIHRSDTRMSATELMREKPKRRLIERAREAYQTIKDRIIEAIQIQRGIVNER